MAIKADDSSLDPEDLRAVEARARLILDKSEAWGRFPTPVDDIVAAANLRVEAKSLRDADGFLAYLTGKAAMAAEQAVEKLKAVKSALSKVFGIYDPVDATIHIDDEVSISKQTFLKLHETGHHELPAHRKLFRFFQDCDQTLSPDIADRFEREANNFARFALFQDDGYGSIAADYKMAVKTPMALAKKFGASIYASCREFARTSHRDCLVIVLNPAEYCNVAGMRCAVRRIEPSPSFRLKFPVPAQNWITLDHPLGRMIPQYGRRMVRPTSFAMEDRNGDPQECVAESFDTTHNIIILIYPVKALTATTIIMPAKAI
ncbi:MAG: ImmA/IrrE family metallo-endopeptidase [Hyphomicrobium sp.]|nr:ImmA/IrrE family metallo-endopeptidase [Hyphomicrobium sp.]